MLLIFSNGFMDFITFSTHLSLHTSRPLLHLATPSLASLLLFCRCLLRHRLFVVNICSFINDQLPLSFHLSDETHFDDYFTSLTSSHLIVTADCRFLLIFTNTGFSLLNIHMDFSSAPSLQTSNFH